MVETEYEIRGSDDSLFCKMERSGSDVVLKTATSREMAIRDGKPVPQHILNRSDERSRK